MTSSVTDTAALAELIRTRLMGVLEDDQDVSLEDAEWAMILSALTPPRRTDQSGPSAERIADAIEACDWSGAPIGNKEILKAAVIALREAALTPPPVSESLKWNGNEVRTPEGDLYSISQLSQIVWTTYKNGTAFPGWSGSSAEAKCRAQENYNALTRQPTQPPELLYTTELVTRDQAEAREADLLRQLADMTASRDAYAKGDAARAAENDLLRHDIQSYVSTIDHLKQRAEAAEAKLAAQGQKPVGYLFETGSSFNRDGSGYVLWNKQQFAASIPSAPEGAIRNIQKVYTAPQPDRSAVLEEAAKVAEGSSKSFDHQAALADHRDCESGFHGGRVAAARSIRALKEPSK